MTAAGRHEGWSQGSRSPLDSGSPALLDQHSIPWLLISAHTRGGALLNYPDERAVLCYTQRVRREWKCDQTQKRRIWEKEGSSIKPWTAHSHLQFMKDNQNLQGTVIAPRAAKQHRRLILLTNTTEVCLQFKEPVCPLEAEVAFSFSSFLLSVCQDDLVSG